MLVLDWGNVYHTSIRMAWKAYEEEGADLEIGFKLRVWNKLRKILEKYHRHNEEVWRNCKKQQLQFI